MFKFSIMGIPRHPDTMVRALPVMTNDLDEAMSAGKAFVAQEPAFLGFIILDQADAEVARWMAPE